MLRGLIQGGYEAALAVAKATRDDIFVRQRGSLPLKAQLDKANTFVEPTEKCLEAENKKGQKLAAQQAELREKLPSKGLLQQRLRLNWLWLKLSWPPSQQRSLQNMVQVRVQHLTEQWGHCATRGFPASTPLPACPSHHSPAGSEANNIASQD